MPTYEYRCNHCGRPVVLTYKTYADYDAATTTRICPHCGSANLTRLISRVRFGKTAESTDYSKMSSNEMLSVLESGNTGDVGAMMHQLGQDQVLNNPATQEVTKGMIARNKPE